MTQEHLTELIDAHQAEIFRYLKYLGADYSVAEDLLQETFIRAYKAENTPDMAIIAARKSWLRRIAQNLFFDHCRSSKRSIIAFNSSVAAEAESFWEEQFIAHNEGFDCLEALELCLQELPEKQQKMVQSFYAERQSRDAVAKVFGVSPDGVKMALRRIRSSLGYCIEQRIAQL